MAVIAAANLKLYLSGGAANADPAMSFGGARSTTEATAAVFRYIRKSGGYYRCLYIRNEDANATGWTSPVMWVSSGSPATAVSVAIGTGAAAKNATETAVASQNTAPDGVTFTAPVTKATGITLPTLSQNDYQAIWLQIIIGAAAVVDDPVSFGLMIEGGTV